MPLRGERGAPPCLFTLNETGAFIWQELARPRTVGELAAALEARFDVAAGRARRDARRLLDRLLAEGCAHELAPGPRRQEAP